VLLEISAKCLPARLSSDTREDIVIDNVVVGAVCEAQDKGSQDAGAIFAAYREEEKGSMARPITFPHRNNRINK
jgi:hypothetical protein